MSDNKKNNEKTTNWMISNFPEELKNAFMGACKAQGKTGTEVMIGVIKQYVDRSIYRPPEIRG